MTAPNPDTTSQTGGGNAGGGDDAPPPCPLCTANNPQRFAQAFGRVYFRCPVCQLTYLDPVVRPTADDERAEYRLHENHPDDPAYRRFLSRAVNTLSDRLAEKGVRSARGLDFGCGPGPAISAMMAERGHRFRNYDPFFHPDRRLLDQKYNAITCTEVVEHFHEPARDFALIDRLLGPQGVLVVMTNILYDDAAFSTWHYIREKSHVAFYRPETMDWIAARFGWAMSAPSATVRLFERL